MNYYQIQDEDILLTNRLGASGNDQTQTWRANRRLYLADLLEDVDAVVGGNCSREMYLGAMLVLALHDIELDVNL